MKKYFILFICLIGVLFSSCMEKEDPYSWSIGQMEIDEPTSEEKVELSPTTKAKSTAPYAVVLETKFMSSQMLCWYKFLIIHFLSMTFGRTPLKSIMLL